MPRTRAAAAPREPRARLDKVRPCLGGDERCGDDFLVCQKDSLQDDFERHGVRDAGGDVGKDESVVFRAERANVEHHVDFAGAVGDGLVRFAVVGLQGFGYSLMGTRTYKAFTSDFDAPRGNPITAHGITPDPARRRATCGMFAPFTQQD